MDAQTFTLSVCVDCYYAAAGLDSESAAALSLLADALRIEPGCDECPICDGAGDEVRTCECGCGKHSRGHGFSRYSCDGCGSKDAGDRFGVLVTVSTRSMCVRVEPIGQQHPDYPDLCTHDVVEMMEGNEDALRCREVATHRAFVLFRYSNKLSEYPVCAKHAPLYAIRENLATGTRED